MLKARLVVPIREKMPRGLKGESWVRMGMFNTFPTSVSTCCLSASTSL